MIPAIYVTSQRDIIPPGLWYIVIHQQSNIQDGVVN